MFMETLPTISNSVCYPLVGKSLPPPLLPQKILKHLFFFFFLITTNAFDIIEKGFHSVSENFKFYAPGVP